jgi:hypothetical protein
MVFIWIVQYQRYSTLSVLFGVSVRTVSVVISTVLPYLVEFFIAYIPERMESSSCSHLSNRIIAITDATIHPIRRPSSKQHLWWSGHYKCHGLLTHLLVDFDGFIVSVITNIKGHTHDANCAIYNSSFQQILGAKFALADPGYQGVNWIVAGFKTSQLTSPAHQVFDQISRSEQAMVEHINNFIKKCAVLDKTTKFIHSDHSKLVACVFIVCGWYNFRKINGHYS